MAETLALAPAPVGHNNPPDPFVAIMAHVDDLMIEARNFCDGAAIESQPQADTVARLIDDFRQAQKAADDARKEEAKPFDEGKAAVQAKYGDLLAETKGQTGAIPRALSALKATLTPWLQNLERERQEAERVAREEAARLAQEAATAMRASDADLAAREAAEALVADAEAAAREAAAIGRDKAQAKGDGRAIGLRRTYRAVMTDRKAALLHFLAERPDAITNLLISLAETEIREGKRSLPGFEIREERRVA